MGKVWVLYMDGDMQGLLLGLTKHGDDKKERFLFSDIRAVRCACCYVLCVCAGARCYVLPLNLHKKGCPGGDGGVVEALPLRLLRLHCSVAMLLAAAVACWLLLGVCSLTYHTTLNARPCPT